LIDPLRMLLTDVELEEDDFDPKLNPAWRE
jgi:hypothetical protein